MRQILFEIPILHLPIYGYGVMLFVAILVSTHWAARLAQRDGADPELIYDLSTWVFIPGLIGARVFYMVQYRSQFEQPLFDFFKIWNGGLVVYGGAIGAIVGLLAFAWRRRVGVLWLLDVITPSMALGLALGRLGCLLNGCCYGDYCPAPWGLAFPPSSPPYWRLVETGVQSRFGLSVDAESRQVLAVEPDTDAYRQGLRAGAIVTAVNEQLTPDAQAFRVAWPDPDQPHPHITLGVTQQGQERTFTLAAPWTVRLHPTQIYSSIDGFVLFGVFSLLRRARRRDGEQVALFGMGYACTRFLIEYLRQDELPLADGLTISQNVSVVLFVVSLATWIYTQTRPVRSYPWKAP